MSSEKNSIIMIKTTESIIKSSKEDIKNGKITSGINKGIEATNNLDELLSILPTSNSEYDLITLAKTSKENMGSAVSAIVDGKDYVEYMNQVLLSLYVIESILILSMNASVSTRSRELVKVSD